MNPTMLSASAVAACGVQECMREVRSFSNSSYRARLAGSVKNAEQHGSLSATGETDWNSKVWTASFPCVRRMNRLHTGYKRLELVTQSVYGSWRWNRPMLARVGGEGSGMTKEWRGCGRSMQNYREVKSHLPGVLQDGPSFVGVTQTQRNAAWRGHDSSSASSCSTTRSPQQLIFLDWTSTTKETQLDDRVRLNSRERSKVESRGTRSLITGKAATLRNASEVASRRWGRFPNKVRASVCRRAILRKFPDTRPDEQNESDEEVKSRNSGETVFQVQNSNASGEVHPEVLFEGGGKIGFVSFYRQLSNQQEPEAASGTRRSLRSLLWLLGPLSLVASVVLPPLHLRKIFGTVLSDSLTTDFVILFFTETLFFIGASVFLYIAHKFRCATESVGSTERKPTIGFPLGYRVSAIVSLGVGLFLPVATFAMVWPWTGPAAAAALAPYMVGILVQLCVEQIVRVNKSPVWPLVPITFQIYRLHQLNRAAQLVAGLMFSLKGVEATAETMAISGSLQTLLFVLQVLGIACLWSLGAFLTHQLPSQPPHSSSTASLP